MLQDLKRCVWKRSRKASSDMGVCDKPARTGACAALVALRSITTTSTVVMRATALVREVALAAGAAAAARTRDTFLASRGCTADTPPPNKCSRLSWPSWRNSVALSCLCFRYFVPLFWLRYWRPANCDEHEEGGRKQKRNCGNVRA